jgi:branched-chain amino acid transport system permease protein
VSETDARTGWGIGLRRLLVVALLLGSPAAAGPFALDLANQVLLAVIGALALMLLTGFAGQISLGHAGLLAAGAFTVGVLTQGWSAPPWVCLPAAALVGALLGLIFGFPSLRLRGIYLVVSTLALHFIVIYLGGEYETRGGYSSGVVIDPPVLFGYTLQEPGAWYYVLLAFSGAVLWMSANLLRSRTGRAWCAIRANETVAEALGVAVARYKLMAFVITSAITAFAGALFGYYRGFVGAEAFSISLAIQYAAMIIIGGMGSLAGAVWGAILVTLLPYLIEAVTGLLPDAPRLANSLFAADYAAFGLVMILFLVFEPGGVMGLWRRWRAGRCGDASPFAPDAPGDAAGAARVAQPQGRKA